MSKKLTIGMATYDDFDGVFMTVQSLLLYQDMEDVELIVVDNGPATPSGEHVRNVVGHAANFLGRDNVQYIPYTAKNGTAAPRHLLFEVAKGDAVMCIDSHVMLWPDAVKNLKKYYEDNPGTKDLLTGPLLYYDIKGFATHFNDQWRGEMHGTWGNAWSCQCGHTKFSPRDDGGIVKFGSLTMDPQPVDSCPKCNKLKLPTSCPLGRDTHILEVQGCKRLGEDPNGEPFEIPGQGLGLFTCRKEAWQGFNPHFRGFGGEELYIHEKFRQAGGKNLCLPFLRWGHRFARPSGIKYVVKVEDKIRNYILGHKEVGWSLDKVHQHFVVEGGFSQEGWDYLVNNPEAEAFPAELKPQFTHNNLPQPGNSVMSPTALYSWARSTPRDIEKHFDTLREYADKCETVVEITGRRETVIPFLVSKAKTIYTFGAEYDLLVKNFRTNRYSTNKDYKFRLVNKTADVQDIEQTDLLFLDMEHNEKDVWDALTRFGDKVNKYLVFHDTSAFGEKGDNGGPGVMPAIRRWLKEKPEWTVVYSSDIQHGLLVLSRLEEDRKALPSLPTMAWNYAKAVKDHVKNNAKQVETEELERRLTICSTCPQRNKERCSVCGCPLAKKASWESSECPLGKWAKEEAKDEPVVA